MRIFIFLILTLCCFKSNAYCQNLRYLDSVVWQVFFCLKENNFQLIGKYIPTKKEMSRFANKTLPKSIAKEVKNNYKSNTDSILGSFAKIRAIGDSVGLKFELANLDMIIPLDTGIDMDTDKPGLEKYYAQKLSADIQLLIRDDVNTYLIQVGFFKPNREWKISSRFVWLGNPWASPYKIIKTPPK